MHNKEHHRISITSLMDMLAETQECVNIAKRAGIADDKIILDPGVGFGKTYEMNLMDHGQAGAFPGAGLSGTSWYLQEIHDWSCS